MCLVVIFYPRKHIRIYGNPSPAEIAQVKKMAHHLTFNYAGKPAWMPAILEKPGWIPVQSFISDFRQSIDVIRREPDGSFVVWYRQPGITTLQKVTFKKQYGQWREVWTFP